MVKCFYCGFENPKKYEYCIHCSKKLERINDDDDTFTHGPHSDNNDLKDLYYLFLGSDSKTTNNNNSDLIFTTKKKFGPITQKQFCATILSVVLCGAGYVYLRKYEKGVLFFFGEIVLLLLTSFLYSIFHLPSTINIMCTASIILYMVNIFDTYIESGKMG